jgi:hypothetical protein
MHILAPILAFSTVVGIKNFGLPNCGSHERRLMQAALIDAHQIVQGAVNVELRGVKSMGYLNATHLQTLRRRYFGEVNWEDDAYVKREHNLYIDVN